MLVDARHLRLRCTLRVARTKITTSRLLEPLRLAIARANTSLSIFRYNRILRILSDRVRWIEARTVVVKHLGKAASLVARVKRAKGGFSSYHNTTFARKARAFFDTLSLLERDTSPGRSKDVRCSQALSANQVISTYWAPPQLTRARAQRARNNKSRSYSPSSLPIRTILSMRVIVEFGTGSSAASATPEQLGSIGCRRRRHAQHQTCPSTSLRDQ